MDNLTAAPTDGSLPVVVESLTPPEILEQARELLGAGWCQRARIKHPASPILRSMCSIGAIDMAALGNASGLTNDLNGHNRSARNEALRILAQQIRTTWGAEPYGSSWAVVMGWNDDNTTTKDEVLHQFELAAKIAKGE